MPQIQPRLAIVLPEEIAGIRLLLQQDVRQIRDILNAYMNIPQLKSFSDATRPTPGKAGRMIFNSTDNGLNVDDGVAWRMPSGGWVIT